MILKDLKKILNVKKSAKLIEQIFTDDAHHNFQHGLKLIINEHGKKLSEGLFTKEELERLEKVKKRRETEKHYNTKRF